MAGETAVKSAASTTAPRPSPSPTSGKRRIRPTPKTTGTMRYADSVEAAKSLAPLSHKEGRVSQ